ncbi:hypothetical protein FRZ67_03245 [Panacibacter ginsenosidivorans]|uniref:Uncharacterized protein n=1 Tax=Panacibacter ginsenosidivorans TaxID=1813871 RepID=A0A5B8V4P6_9BACT|nr:hypothetical protein [Panacibacter ginsenosidivorans]QEC66364.1 hypothetical protein FRZ67_03245 [Panacibacter ginsenosidivorans]
MNYDYQQTDFSKALMAGLFAGIVATLANLGYDFFYRDITGFQLSQIINVASIIIASTLLLTIAGIGFYFFKHNIKKGGIIYRLIFFVLTFLCVYLSVHVQRSTDPIVSNEFRGLLTGIVIILGGLAVFFIPYLFDHDEIYS